MFDKLPLAKNVSYYKTSAASPDAILDKTERLVCSIGGSVHTRFFGTIHSASAVVFGFDMGGESFKVTWPILPVSKEADKQAARRQAASLIYHDIKAKMNAVKVFGPKIGFASYLLLQTENGKKTISEIVSKKDFSLKLLN